MLRPVQNDYQKLINMHLQKMVHDICHTSLYFVDLSHVSMRERQPNSFRVVHSAHGFCSWLLLTALCAHADASTDDGLRQVFRAARKQHTTRQSQKVCSAATS